MRRDGSWILWLCAAPLLIVSCFSEPGPAGRPPAGARGGADAGAGEGGESNGAGGSAAGRNEPPPPPPVAGEAGAGGSDVGPACEPLHELDPDARCRTLTSAEPLHLRIPSAEATDVTVFVSEIFNQLKANCGACHVGTSNGDFEVKPDTLPAVIDAEVLAILKSDDPAIFMPPPDAKGIPFRDRSDADPVRKLANMIAAWLEQGSPPDVFTLPADQGGRSPYLYDEAFAASVTNIGSCLPDRGLFATEAERSCELDAMFAGLARRTGDGSTEIERIGLPRYLEQTDLFTLDSEALARQGVVAYAPLYPLWSDDAGKLRHVRVPRGQSIAYDAEAREFEIPENTRFYKTFLKKIVDKDGSERFKKIETRLIVARQDRDAQDGSIEQRALFGTYVWNEQETRAELLTDLQIDRNPFTDRLLRYVTDEVKAAQVLAELPPGRNKDTALKGAKVLRHYAVPSRQRCVDCHRGSPSESFVLGFTPIQLRRRPKGEGGVLEESSDDELSQLERLVDYGVVSGIRSVDEVPLLEDSQGDRRPRNDFELVAQGYLLGNCAHCHNPRGFATQAAPELKDLLDFWPRPDGGIFQFPLDRTSPRIKRRQDLAVSIPYITPSLRDIVPARGESTFGYASKVQLTGPNSGEFLDAPWRSLIFRNVATPFIYADHYAIFPHMPRHTPGFDCRAPRIVADWMVSIPSTRLNPQLREDWVNDQSEGEPDNTPQPYREVSADETSYLTALGAAQKRLDALRASPIYQHCPNTTDIVDPTVVAEIRIIPQDGEDLTAPIDGVPDRPHWVTLDDSQPPGDWAPRRGVWDEVLNGAGPDPSGLPTDTNDGDYYPERIRFDAEKAVVELLRGAGSNAGVTLDDVRSFATAEFPFGRWKVDPDQDCDFSSLPRLSDLGRNGTFRPKWAGPLGSSETQTNADEHDLTLNPPVYMTLPGEAIFNMICFNCHGSQADSKGAIAATLAEMTGGNARVANFRSGLFGTDSEGLLNRDVAFGDAAEEAGIDPSDMAARYMAWMGLGGTTVRIPREIFNLIRSTQVLGTKRTGNPVGTQNLSANMLAVAQELCRGTLGRVDNVFEILADGKLNWNNLYAGTGLITTNGDAELWEILCSLENPSPVRALSYFEGKLKIAGFYARAAYPASAPVGNQEPAVVAGIADRGPTYNWFPWCVIEPAAGTLLHAEAVEYVTSHPIGGQPLPFCPSELITSEHRLEALLNLNEFYRDDFQHYAARGAVNAGLAVFLYLEEFVRKGRTPRPPFDQCEKLAP